MNTAISPKRPFSIIAVIAALVLLLATFGFTGAGSASQLAAGGGIGRGYYDHGDNNLTPKAIFAMPWAGISTSPSSPRG